MIPFFLRLQVAVFVFLFAALPVESIVAQGRVVALTESPPAPTRGGAGGRGGGRENAQSFSPPVAGAWSKHRCRTQKI